MNIGQFNSITSSSHQQPLPSTSRIEGKGPVTTQEIIHQWDVNGFLVSLIKEQDSLKYITDRGLTEIYTDYIEISEEDNLEEIVSYLKESAVMVGDDGHVNFCSIYNTWKVNYAEESYLETLNLVHGPAGLVWNVFRECTNSSYFFDFQKITIPSLRCHPETIALIDKIKTETFNNRPLLYRLIKDFKPIIVRSKMFEQKLNEDRKKILADQEEHYLRSINTKLRGVQYPFIFASGMYMLRKTTVSVVKSTNRFFGGGVLGGTAGLLAVASMCLIPRVVCQLVVGIKNQCFFNPSETLYKKQEALQNTLLPKYSLSIEIEPISAPSRIDERVCVSKFIWAVTVITHSGCFGNHAQIVVEGINDGFYSNETPRTTNGEIIENGEKFTYMAEFNPPIESKLILPEEDLPVETRTETWLRTSNEVKKMLEDIEQEKSLPKKNRRVFNALGKDSKLYRINIHDPRKTGKIGDNCFNWSRDKVKIIGVILNKSSFEPIVTLAKFHTLDDEICKELPVANLI